MDQNRESIIFEPSKSKSDANPNVSEQMDAFLKEFNHFKIEIYQNLEHCKNVDKAGLADHFDKLTVELQKLQKLLADSTGFLPSYTIRTSSECLKELEDSIQAQQAIYLPKKKFAFKSRVKEGEKKSNIELLEHGNDEVDSTIHRLQSQFYGFKNETDKTLQKVSEEIASKDIELTNLTNCTVLLLGTPNTIHFSKIKNSKLFIGPVITSVFIDDCSSCIFVVACQQLRVHSTKRCDFYLHAVSNPIIEDCIEVRFAPYSLEYELLMEQFDLSGLDKKVNKWNSVNDFNWLAVDVQSPNWSVIPAEERCTWRF